MCALVVLVLGDYLAAGRLTGFLVQTAVGTCVLMVVVGVLIKVARRRAEAATVG